TSSTPWRRTSRKLCSTTGIPPTGTIALGTRSVRGRRRVPWPAASSIAFTITSRLRVEAHVLQPWEETMLLQELQLAFDTPLRFEYNETAPGLRHPHTRDKTVRPLLLAGGHTWARALGAT